VVSITNVASGEAGKGGSNRGAVCKAAGSLAGRGQALQDGGIKIKGTARTQLGDRAAGAAMCSNELWSGALREINRGSKTEWKLCVQCLRGTNLQRVCGLVLLGRRGRG
jgi:hypothetical protein